jgi:uroporphyrinogen-III synthase
LTQTLAQRGAEVVELALYVRGLPKVRSDEIEQMTRQNQIHLVTVTSIESLSNLQQLLGVEGQEWLKQTGLLAGSQRIADRARSEGFREILVASDPSDESMFDAVLQWNEEYKADSHE